MTNEHDIVAKIEKDARLGKIKMPRLPDVALKVRKAIQDPKFNNQHIAKLIQMDPTLTARLIQIANSPLYRGKSAVNDCLTAITRLGLSVTRNFVTSFCLRQVYDIRVPSLKKRIRQNWRHSCEVAAICYILAGTEPKIQADQAMLAGLLHDIGVLPVLHYISENPHIAQDEALTDRIIKHLRGQLGAYLLTIWNFSPAYTDAARECENWFRQGSAHIDYTDIVIVAQLHHYLGTTQNDLFPSLTQIPAFKKFSFFLLGPAASLEIMDNAKEEIQDIMKMLN